MARILEKVGCSLFAAAALAGCVVLAPHQGAGVSSMSKTVARFNQGAALFEQYSYVKAAEVFEDVVKAAPGWTAARFNLGLAYFNMQENRGAEEYLTYAGEAFEAVLRSDPNHLHARFCLGLYHQHLGKNEEALECFEAVRRADDADPHVAYKYAEVLMSLGRDDEGSKLLEKVIERDAGFVSAVYRLALQYQRVRQRDKAQSLFDRFKDLKTTELTGGSFSVLQSYGTVGKYFTALGADDLPLSRVYPKTRLLFWPEVRHFEKEIAKWNCPGGTVGLAGMAAGDVDGDGDLDFVVFRFAGGSVPSAGPFEPAASSLYNNNRDGTYTDIAEKVGLRLEEGTVATAVYDDFDNDRDLDFVIFPAGGGDVISWVNDRVWQYHLLDAEATGLRIKNVVGAISGDPDEDGDRDLLVFTGEGVHLFF